MMSPTMRHILCFPACKQLLHDCESGAEYKTRCWPAGSVIEVCIAVETCWQAKKKQQCHVCKKWNVQKYTCSCNSVNYMSASGTGVKRKCRFPHIQYCNVAASSGAGAKCWIHNPIQLVFFNSSYCYICYV